MSRLVLEQVTKSFSARNGQPVLAVKEISISLTPCELLALVGPSGCGKTTTLRLIAGLEAPDAGTIKLDDRVANQTLPKDRDVAMVFQQHALYPHMTAAENIALGLTLRGIGRAEISQRVNELAGKLALTKCLSRKPAELSSGERQRVALARALIRKPGILLLDEPFANLDAPLRRDLRRELMRLHREQHLTTLLVTHDQTEALAMGDRVAVMNQGRVEQIGPPAELRAQPATPFVAAFLDSSVV